MKQYGDEEAAAIIAMMEKAQKEAGVSSTVYIVPVVPPVLSEPMPEPPAPEPEGDEP